MRDMNNRWRRGVRLPRPRRTAATAALVALVAGLTAVPGAAQDLGPHTGLTQAAARTGADRTQIVASYIFTQAFRALDFGYASAIALVLLVLLLAYSMLIILLRQTLLAKD